MLNVILQKRAYIVWSFTGNTLMVNIKKRLVCLAVVYSVYQKYLLLAVLNKISPGLELQVSVAIYMRKGLTDVTWYLSQINAEH